ncbi:7130_t:CDS:2, partial [Cetraspora pellucida]
ICHNLIYSLIAISSSNPWLEICLICDSMDLKNNEHLSNDSTEIFNNDEICEINQDEMLEMDEGIKETEQKHAQLSQALRILDESKGFSNYQKFLNNMETKITPLKKLVEDIIHYENKHKLSRTWKD